VLSILYYSGRRFDYFKLGTHPLNLRGLLFELGRESVYLFLLLSDRCFQLVNFAILGLVRELGARTRRRHATLQRRSRLACFNLPPKLVGSEVYSYFNNGAANRLLVIEDTTDEAG
jgi:hypothetical protein